MLRPNDTPMTPGTIRVRTAQTPADIRFALLQRRHHGPAETPSIHTQNGPYPVGHLSTINWIGLPPATYNLTSRSPAWANTGVEAPSLRAVARRVPRSSIVQSGSLWRWPALDTIVRFAGVSTFLC